LLQLLCYAAAAATATAIIGGTADRSHYCITILPHSYFVLHLLNPLFAHQSLIAVHAYAQISEISIAAAVPDMCLVAD
jgi:hypothetical protein